MVVMNIMIIMLFIEMNQIDDDTRSEEALQKRVYPCVQFCTKVRLCPPNQQVVLTFIIIDDSGTEETNFEEVLDENDDANNGIN